MKKIRLTLCLGILNTSIGFAQLMGLPPTTMNGSTDLCETGPFQLVFFDDFNGNSLDSIKWNDYISWNGMPTGNGDTDKWGGARIGDNGTAYLKENVKVNNGTCKLIMKHGNFTWTQDVHPHPDTTIMQTFTRYRSGAIISTPYRRRPSNNSNYYNSGMFEARIKYPRFNGAWCAFWLWRGSYDVNEIDISEAYGGIVVSAWLRKPYNAHLNGRPNTNNVLHAWRPTPNPYNLPEDVSVGNAYPGQSWRHWYKGTHFRQDLWHTYRCIWDSTNITMFLDGEQVAKYYKYHRTTYAGYTHSNGTNIIYGVLQPSLCLPSSGDWYVLEGYPWHPVSNASIRIEARYMTENAPSPNSLPQSERQVEVDYVRAWQRDPAADGHNTVCSEYGQSQILGPDVVCGPTMFVISPGNSGTWTTSNDAVVIDPVALGKTAVITPNSSSVNSYTVITFTYEPGEGCPPVTLTRTIYVGNKNISAFVTRNWYSNTQTFNLVADPQIPGSTYNWKVWYGTSSDPGLLNYYTANGPVIITPNMFHNGYKPYYIKWELTVNNICGTKVYNGTMNNLIYVAPQILKSATIVPVDSSGFYFETRLNNVDSLNYEEQIFSIMSKQAIENLEDASAVAELINNVRFDALEPYLYFEDINDIDLESQTINYKSNNWSLSDSASGSKVYPNPGSDLVSIQFAKQFDITQEVSYFVKDIYGREVMRGVTSRNIDISRLNAGNFFIQLLQGSNSEYLRLIKVN